MADFKPTEAQKRALDLSLSMAVTAGAGSGKTSVLVNRYLAALEYNRNIGVRNVLAITFTEKAAAEMKQRVREEVEEKLAQGKDVERWRSVLETFDHAAISTIHSFCLSILREHPVEAGVDPLFEMLDETQARRLRRQAAEEALQRSGEEPSTAADVTTLLRAWGRRSTSSSIALLFEKAEAGAIAWARFYRDTSDEEIKADMQGKVRDLWMAQALALFSNEIASKLAALECPNSSSKIEQMRLHALAVIRAGLEQPEYETLAEVVNGLCEIDLRLGGRSSWGGFDECKGLLKEIRESAIRLRGLVVGEVDWNSVPLLKALSAMFLRARDIYEEYKGHGRRLDFDDLQRRALELLRDGRAGIRSEIHERFATVLVDEFQDTNHQQWELVRHVVQDANGVLPVGKLFIVGDPKQSIYGFREAEIQVFGKVKAGFICENGRVEMDENFRAAAEPTAFVNRLMNGWMGALSEPFDPEYRDLVCRRNVPVAGSVSLILAPKDAEPPADDAVGGDEEDGAAERSSVAPQEAELIARQILSFVHNGVPVWDKALKQARGAQFGDVAILLRARTRLSSFEDALRGAGVPFTVLGGLGFYERQEVQDIVNLARFLLHQGNDIALAALLRSPLVGLSDDTMYRISQAQGERLWDRLQAPGDLEEVDALAVHRGRLLLHQWLKWSRRLPLAELLEQVLRQSGLWGAVAGGERGEQCIANIEKVLGLARCSPDLAGFVAELEDLLEEEAREGEAQIELEKSNSVKILTIHAAKGLEFPIVCVANTSFLAGRRWPPEVYFHRDYGMGIKSRVAGSDEKPQDTVMRRLIASLMKKQDAAESVRLLYVALTRCRDHLVVSGTLPGGNGSWMRAICERLQIDADHPEDIPGAVVHTDASRIPINEPQPPLRLDELLNRYNEAGRLAGKMSGVCDEQLASLGPLPAVGAALPRFSPTALERYLACPYSYFLTERLGVPHTGALEDEMPEPALVFTAPGASAAPESSYLKVGTIAHRYFEEMPPVKPADEREVIMRLVSASEVSDTAERERIADLVARMAASFRASDFGRRVLSAAESYTEVAFAVPVGRGAVYGKIDRLYRDARGWKILDYKTDNVRESELAARCERYKPQLFAYSLAVGKLLGCEPPEAWLYFARPARAVPLRLTRDAAAAFERKLSDAIEQILNGQFSPVGECPDTCHFREAGLCE
ncbi:MAG TPA: UvrD-helicase domain-containing protein [Planctomycetota bacterium]|nr:UvrD-helicase domain-containing protein [Planctomycetota bacterium]